MQKAFLSEPITSCKDDNDTIPAVIFYKAKRDVDCIDFGFNSQKCC